MWLLELWLELRLVYHWCLRPPQFGELHPELTALKTSIRSSIKFHTPPDDAIVDLPAAKMSNSQAYQFPSKTVKTDYPVSCGANWPKLATRC